MVPVKNLKMEKYEDGIESRRQNKGSKKISSKNTNLDALVDKNTLLDSITSSDFSIFRFLT
eukprot:Pgem_evm1s9434